MLLPYVCLSCLSYLWHWCIVAKRWDGSRWNLACRYRPRPWPHCVRWGPSSPKRAQPQIFLAHICCGQMAAWINMPLGMEVGLGPGNFVLDYDCKKIAPRMHRNSLFLAQKIKKKFCGRAQPPPHSPPPWAPTVPLAPRSYGARPRCLRHLGCPPDLLTLPPHFHTPSAAYVRSERAMEQKFQGTKRPESESARERFGF